MPTTTSLRDCYPYTVDRVVRWSERGSRTARQRVWLHDHRDDDWLEYTVRVDLTSPNPTYPGYIVPVSTPTCHEPQWPWWLLPVGSAVVAAVIVLVFGG